MCLDRTNHYLTSVRDALKISKELTRRELINEERKRNQHLRQLLTENAPSLYEVRVYINAELRNELNIKKEKRARMFIRKDSNSAKTLKGVMEEIKFFFPALHACPLSITAALPIVMEDGSMLCPEDSRHENGNDDLYKRYRAITDDDCVIKMFQEADDFCSSRNQCHGNQLKRPIVLLHVKKDLTDFPLEVPSYLVNLPNPKETKTITMLSFYSFPPGGISDPEHFVRFLKKVWEPFDVLGRVYVATEGVNAQMAVPTNMYV
jgi:hypothetical protein